MCIILTVKRKKHAFTFDMLESHSFSLVAVVFVCVVKGGGGLVYFGLVLLHF